jgi:hypothetical protein
MDLGSDNDMLIFVSANDFWPVDTTEGDRSKHSSTNRVGNLEQFFLPVSMGLAVLSKCKYRYLNFVYETLF